MDGTLGDKFELGRRIRLATFQYAVDVFPGLIIKLLQGSLLIDHTSSPEQKQVVTLYSNRGIREDHYVILVEDFEICRQIGSDISLPLFATDPNKVYEERARALVRLRFYGRP